ncbi:MAG: glutathione S-transferase family protein [Thiolinea sp.]
MSNYKLTYFDIDGGRAEATRIALHAAGIDFEDNRLSFPEFGQQQFDMRFHAVPVMEIDGAQVTQSNALNRYIGKMAGLYPTDDLQALYCDEVMDAVEDLTHHMTATFGLEGEEMKLAREAFVSGWLTVYLKGLSELLQRGGGEYFAGGQLTIADLKVFVQTQALEAGFLDHVPTDIVQQVAPALHEHAQRVTAEPNVVAYYASKS